MIDKKERFILLMWAICQLIILLCFQELARIMLLWCTIILVPGFIVAYIVGCKISTRMIHPEQFE